MISQILVEIPYNIIGATIYFFCSYWPLRVYQNSRLAGEFYLMSSIIYQIYVPTFAVDLYYFSPDVQAAAALSSVVTVFMFSFAGVLQPVSIMPGFWTFMYKVSPITYAIQSLTATIVHGKELKCSKNELAYFSPPQGQTCGEYVSDFMSTRGGYLVDPNATDECGYCQFDSQDAYVATRGIKYTQYWRNFGLFWVYILFNVASMMFLYWLQHDAKFSFGKKSSKKSTEVKTPVESKFRSNEDIV
ncbi:Pleiotropic ABC efflux transporter [Wickerhamomyces ciferrii]|uniref:Pleiotropic ABC efflux transporter n=1 Tax=Wickerhamomyces ciferrii (strain ATCC 14091 / BCRC 22168 / CBS 111 / JCM 3599 / NBRC 0793 / NRRL Y-1031 F-60-10) TaxID=1206466 RepID=K0KML8_WICCF|nr:Pleiotropic ABC efflux transporter [Wickerhamomyces ciferrii]CCH43447.1 Pleiotropic ABC efflux transporter [Wickerhamomyces ciferrii]